VAVRIRLNGQILCAAMHPAEEGDTYIHDGLHGRLASETGTIVTEPMYCDGGRSGHAYHGEWWWRDRVPADVEVDPFYLKCGSTSFLRQVFAIRAESVSARARGPVVGLDVVALGASVVVVVFLGARLLGMKRVYLRHNSPPFLSGIRGRRAYSSGGGAA
jgi:hypothetical protein